MTTMSVVERGEILTDNEGWFGRAAAEFQQAVLSRCVWRAVTAGEHIYRASDREADMSGIVAGTVEIYSRYGAGDNPMLHLAHEGFWIGYGAAAFREQRLRVTVVARTNVLLASITSRAMHQLLHERPQWWPYIASALVEYGDIAIAAYADSLIGASDRRCACTLLRVAGLRSPRRSRPDRPAIPIAQDELATLVNVSRTTLLQILRRFEDRGLLEQGYRSLRILDAERLKEVADGHDRTQ